MTDIPLRLQMIYPAFAKQKLIQLLSCLMPGNPGILPKPYKVPEAFCCLIRNPYLREITRTELVGKVLNIKSICLDPLATLFRNHGRSDYLAVDTSFR